jgi:hypothetical protein
MRVLALLFALAVGIPALLGCGGASAFVGVGCHDRCDSCNNDADCCGDDQCFFFSPFGPGICQEFPGEC